MLKSAIKFSLTIIIVTACAVLSQAETSEVTVFPTKAVWGKGPLPYNYRVIDGHIHVGGHPLNPGTGFGNSDQQVLNILNYLKSQSVEAVVDLQNSRDIEKRYLKLLRKAGLKRIHVPMHAKKMPDKKEWQKIKKALEKPVYIHCKWGADRAGAIIGRYLVEVKGYSSQEAYEAVISKGSHAGPIGGLKQSPSYQNLARFVWPGYSGSKQ